jgi:hypothetical protein
MTSDDSPYATHAQLQTVMASIDVIVQKVAPNPKPPKSPNRKRSKQESYDDMETDILSGDEKLPDDPHSPPKRQ